MVRNNNMIPFGHFHKDWQKNVKMWFSQPMDKERRRKKRQMKQMRLAPKPVEFLRPAVQCPTSRYNTKIRAGRGFTVLELKRSGINIKLARTVGIAVDYRRKNKSNDSLAKNVQRLKEYQAKLVLLPKNGRNVPFENDTGATLNRFRETKAKLSVASIGDGDRKFEAYITLRKARAYKKYQGRRLKRKLSAADGFDGKDKISH